MVFDLRAFAFSSPTSMLMLPGAPGSWPAAATPPGGVRGRPPMDSLLFPGGGFAFPCRFSRWRAAACMSKWRCLTTAPQPPQARIRHPQQTRASSWLADICKAIQSFHCGRTAGCSLGGFGRKRLGGRAAAQRRVRLEAAREHDALAYRARDQGCLCVAVPAMVTKTEDQQTQLEYKSNPGLLEDLALSSSS